jgi:hypothetical protein
MRFGEEGCANLYRFACWLALDRAKRYRLPFMPTYIGLHVGWLPTYIGLHEG